MYNKTDHKVLKNSPENKKLYHHLKEEIMQNPNISSEISFEFFKIPKKGAKPKKLPKMVENDLWMTFR